MCQGQRSQPGVWAGPDLLAEAGGDSVLGRLGELSPGLLLTGAEGEGHGCRQTHGHPREGPEVRGQLPAQVDPLGL